MKNKNITLNKMRYQSISILADNPSLATMIFSALDINSKEWIDMTTQQIVLIWMYCQAYACSNVYQSIAAMDAVETLSDMLNYDKINVMG